MSWGGGEKPTFKIEAYDGPLRQVGFKFSDDYKKLENTLEKIKPREAFTIPKEWTGHVHNIVRDKQLQIKVVVIKIVDNDKHRRVLRLY